MDQPLHLLVSDHEVGGTRVFVQQKGAAPWARGYLRGGQDNRESLYGWNRMFVIDEPF